MSSLSFCERYPFEKTLQKLSTQNYRVIEKGTSRVPYHMVSMDARGRGACTWWEGGGAVVDS